MISDSNMTHTYKEGGCGERERETDRDTQKEAEGETKNNLDKRRKERKCALAPVRERFMKNLERGMIGWG